MWYLNIENTTVFTLMTSTGTPLYIVPATSPVTYRVLDWFSYQSSLGKLEYIPFRIFLGKKIAITPHALLIGICPDDPIYIWIYRPDLKATEVSGKTAPDFCDFG